MSPRVGWLDKACIDQRNINDGLRSLPINVMACRRVLVLWGPTYAFRLWCVWELFTLLAFTHLERAAERIIAKALADEGDASTMVAEGLKSFSVDASHCYDPNEEASLRMVIDALGARRFNRRVRALGQALDPGQRKTAKGSAGLKGSSSSITDEVSVLSVSKLLSHSLTWLTMSWKRQCAPAIVGAKIADELADTDPDPSSSSWVSAGSRNWMNV